MTGYLPAGPIDDAPAAGRVANLRTPPDRLRERCAYCDDGDGRPVRRARYVYECSQCAAPWLVKR